MLEKEGLQVPSSIKEHLMVPPHTSSSPDIRMLLTEFQPDNKNIAEDLYDRAKGVVGWVKLGENRQ